MLDTWLTSFQKEKNSPSFWIWMLCKGGTSDLQKGSCQIQSYGPHKTCCLETPYCFKKRSYLCFDTCLTAAEQNVPIKNSPLCENSNCLHKLYQRRQSKINSANTCKQCAGLPVYGGDTLGEAGMWERLTLWCKKSDPFPYFWWYSTGWQSKRKLKKCTFFLFLPLA